MPPAEPPTEVTVRVKIPPGHIPGSSADEFTLGIVSTSSLIGDLRQQIQQLLPSHPSPDRQRLLYAGRALVDNEQTLSSALNTRRDTSQTEYVLHLLVKGDQDAVGGRAVPRGVPSLRSIGDTNNGAGLLNAGSPQEQGNDARITPQPGNVPPQGLPQLPPGVSQQQVLQQYLQQQERALLQNNMRLQSLQEARREFNAQAEAGRALPHQQGRPAENHAGSGQDSAQGAGQGIPENTAQSDGTAAIDAQPFETNTTRGRAPQQPQHPHGPHRPVSGQGFHAHGVGPNGNRFEIHQQTFNLPFPGQQAQFGLPMPGMPGMGLPFPYPGMAQQRQPNPAQQPNGPSALDRARQNVAEMRQMVDAMRTDNATEEDRARAARLQEHIQAINDYIDPIFGGARPTSTTRSASPFPPRMAQSMRASPSLGLGPFAPPPRPQPNPMMPNLSQQTKQHPPSQSSTSDTTCYLLSSPDGPAALLFTPQNGVYTSGRAPHLATGVDLGVGQGRGLYRVAPAIGTPGQAIPTPTQNAAPAHGQQAQGAGAPAVDPAVAAAQQVAQQVNLAQQAQVQARAQAQAQDNPLGPMQPILGHFWLLLRVLIFAYFILGTNMGWRRPLALGLIGLGFWMLRAGLFGEGGVARRWWDGIVRVEQRPRQQAQGEGAAAGEGEQRAAGQLPTPEELAQRLIQDRQQALDRAPLHRIREHLRPVERAAALFFASLWPGVGEAHVRAREAEERRVAEEEVALRRREEEERQRAIEAEQEGEKKEEQSSADAGEKAAVEKEAPPAAAEDNPSKEAVVHGESSSSPVAATGQAE